VSSSHFETDGLSFIARRRPVKGERREKNKGRKRDVLLLSSNAPSTFREERGEKRKKRKKKTRVLPHIFTKEAKEKGGEKRGGGGGAVPDFIDKELRASLI